MHDHRLTGKGVAVTDAMCEVNWALVWAFAGLLLSPQVVAGTLVTAFVVYYRVEIRDRIQSVVEASAGGARVLMAAKQASAGVGASVPEADPVVAPNTGPAAPAPGPPAIANPTGQAPAEDRALFWEFNYLNFYLARDSLATLVWLSRLTGPISYEDYDSHLAARNLKPHERDAINRALSIHYLVHFANIVKISLKGTEYLKFRGPLPATAA